MVPSANVVNAFWQSLRGILSHEGYRVEAGKLTLKNPLPDERQLVVVIGMSGQMRGTLQWRMSMETAANLGRRLTGSSGSGLDELQISGLSELLHIVFGQAVTRLESNYLMALPSPPVVLLGNSTLVAPGFPVLNLPVVVDGAVSSLCFAFQVEEDLLPHEAAVGYMVREA